MGWKSASFLGRTYFKACRIQRVIGQKSIPARLAWRGRSPNIRFSASARKFPPPPPDPLPLRRDSQKLVGDTGSRSHWRARSDGSAMTMLDDSYCRARRRHRIAESILDDACLMRSAPLSLRESSRRSSPVILPRTRRRHWRLIALRSYDIIRAQRV